MKISRKILLCVPNSLTLCNSLCGFAAILYALTVYEPSLRGAEREALGVFAICAWIILFAMIFDALDGFSARLLNATSLHGIQMDSLSDMVTFGLAPAVVAAIMTHWMMADMQKISLWYNFVTYTLCAIYVGGAALRLATYNVHALLEKKSDELFTGLPSPGAAAGICSVVLVWGRFSDRLEPLVIWLPAYAAVLGLLMVSPAPYFHVGKYLVSLKQNPRRRLWTALTVAVLALTQLPGLVILLNCYIFGSPLIWLFRKLSRAGRERAA